MVIPYHIAEPMAVNPGLGWMIIVCGGDVKHHLAFFQLRKEPLIFIHSSRMPLSAPVRPEEDENLLVKISSACTLLSNSIKIYGCPG